MSLRSDLEAEIAAVYTRTSPQHHSRHVRQPAQATQWERRRLAAALRVRARRAALPAAP